MNRISEKEKIKPLNQRLLQKTERNNIFIVYSGKKSIKKERTKLPEQEEADLETLPENEDDEEPSNL